MRSSYKHIDLNDLADLYYANTGNYDWRTRKGKPDMWKYSLDQIRVHFGFGNINNITDRFKRNPDSPGIRTAIPGCSDRRPRTENREPIAGGTNGNSGAAHDAGRLVRTAVMTQLIVQAMRAPKVAEALHEVAVGLATTMGYTTAPTKADVMSYLAKLI